MKILILNPWGLDGRYSGPAVLVDRLFGALVSRHPDIEAHLAYRTHRSLEDSVPAWASRSFPITVVGPMGRSSRLTQMLWSFRVYRLLCRRDAQYDLIHVQGAYANNLIPLILRPRTLQLAILPVLQGGDLNAPSGFLGVYVSARRQLLSSGALCLSLTDGIAREFEAQGGLRDNVVTLPNVVDIDRFGPRTRPHPRVAGRPFTAGFAGKLGPVKRPHLLLEALRVMIDHGFNANAVFVGPFESKDYQNEFDNRLRSLNLADCVTVTGYTSDVARHMNDQFDAFVLPSSSEGLPGALVEAMASGLPSVVTDAGGMRGVIEAANCGIVVGPDPESIATALESMCTDQELWRHMSSAGRRYAEGRFSTHIVADIYYDAIRGSIQSPATHGKIDANR